MPAPSVGSPLLWIAFGVFVFLMLALDLGVFHRDSHEVSSREALIWTGVWVALALLFNAGITLWFGRQRGLEFLTGYVIEYSLSVDNIFVFILIFKYFSVPAGYQHRVLFWGVLGALVMRLAFILAGAALLNRFEWIMYLFGVALILGGAKMLKEEEMEVHPERNLVLRIFQKFVRTTSQDAGGSLFLRRAGRFYATPLLLVLVVVEATDVVFAADSIPAIFGVTRDPFVAFTSNIFAIMGLRSLYFLLASVLNRFHYLKVGLGLVLIFVGGKMLLDHYIKVSIGTSLAVVAVLLGASIALSFARPAKLAPHRKEEPPPIPPWSRKHRE